MKIALCISGQPRNPSRGIPNILKYLNTRTDFLTMINNIKPPNLGYHQVSKDVNNPDNNRENLIDQI